MSNVTNEMTVAADKEYREAVEKEGLPLLHSDWEKVLTAALAHQPKQSGKQVISVNALKELISEKCATLNGDDVVFISDIDTAIDDLSFAQSGFDSEALITDLNLGIQLSSRLSNRSSGETEAMYDHTKNELSQILSAIQSNKYSEEGE